MNMKLHILIITCLVNVVFFGNTQTANEVVTKIITLPELESASIGIYAIDVTSKKVVMEYNSNKLLTPASTTKLFSTALALDVLGGDYRPQTSIYYNGKIENNKLEGDIWIIGGGDVSLGSKFFEKENKDAFLVNWLKIFQELGIQEINGGIYVDGSDFGYDGVPDDWLWGDIGNFYGTHFSGAMVYDNLLEYHFKTGAAGKKVELMYTIPELDSFVFINNILSSTKTGDNSYMFGAPYSNVREGRGTLSQNNSDFMVKGSLPDPEYQLGKALKQKLESVGVIVKGNVYSTRVNQVPRPNQTWTKVTDYKGKQLKEIVRATNFESINVFAEGVMRLASFEKNKDGSHDRSSNYMLDFWKNKLGAKSLFINDGSGLSRTNAISAKTMSDLLLYMNSSKASTDFYESLPIAGVSGTLKSVCKNQLGQGKVHAKSGTMRRTKSYAGYVEASSGKKIAFAFIFNQYTVSNKEVVQYMEQLMNALAKE